MVTREIPRVVGEGKVLAEMSKATGLLFYFLLKFLKKNFILHSHD